MLFQLPLLETSKSTSRLNLQSQGKTANTPVTPISDSFPAINNNLRSTHLTRATSNNNIEDASHHQKPLPLTPTGNEQRFKYFCIYYSNQMAQFLYTGTSVNCNIPLYIHAFIWYFLFSFPTLPLIKQNTWNVRFIVPYDWMYALHLTSKSALCFNRGIYRWRLDAHCGGTD